MPRGRPPLRKKGAMTSAERQRRHRRKLRAARRQAQIKQKQAINHAKYLASRAAPRPQSGAEAAQEARREEWLRLYSRPMLPGAAGAADEIARQIDECLTQQPEISIDDVRAAIDRRWPPKD